MQHSRANICTISFVIILFLMGSAVASFLTQKTSSTINSRVEIEDMLPSQIHEMSFKDVKEVNVKRPEMGNGYKPHFLPIYIQGNDDLTGLRGILNGVRGGEGIEDDPYVISGWELQGWKYWKLVGRHYAIFIENVDKHVVIKDNYIHDWWYSIGHDYLSGGIHILHSSNITIENNIVEKNLWGISMYASSPIINHNTVTQNYDGVTCGGYSASDPVVSNNTIYANYDDGVSCGHANARVIFNQVFSNGDDGIDSINEDRSFIAYNTVYDNREDGIDFGGVLGKRAHPIIANNDIFSNGRYGVGCYDPTEAIIRNNSIYSNGADGISCHDSNPTIIDNIISSNGGDGIRCRDCSSSIISHNLITLNSDGIECDDNPTITNNTITLNHRGIKYIGSTRLTEPTIYYNNIEGNGYGVYNSYYLPRAKATHNWWGSSDGPSGVGPGSGDKVSSFVDYNPWLTEPNPDAGPR